MKCTNCGADLANTDSFCQNCGVPVNQGGQAGYGPGRVPQQGRQNRSSILVPILLLVAAVFLAAAGGLYYLTHRIPDVAPLSYDELVTDYSLYSDDSDRIKNEYYENVRIEFEDVSRKKSGFKATAVLYTPDMEEIYQKTTDEISVIDELERISEGDLRKSRKAVLLMKGDGELTHNSAEVLQDEVDKKFLSVDEYAAMGGAASDQSEENSSDEPSSSASASVNITNVTGEEHHASTPSSSGTKTSGYIIPDSSSRVISSSELNGLSAWQCKLARNEIYARHGRKFKDSSLQNYFNGCSWYVPTVEADSFNESVLNSVEKKNIKTIQSYEKSNGSTSSQSSSSQSSTQSATPSETNTGGYIISDSSSRVISSSELDGLSAWQCKLARNEIYARHGRKFKDSSLQSYFNGCSWYVPTVEADSFNESVLNSCEKENINTIKSYESAHGYS